VQLIDAETGAHLWAERFDKPVAVPSRSWLELRVA
jgi:TolB-like protein